jgi:hypothetical protein
MLGHSFDVYSEGCMLSDFMAFFGSFSNGDQQVLHSFVIDLHHRNMDLIVFVWVIILGNSGKNLFTRDGDDTLNVKYGTLLAP